ncbi:MAG: hypothetical protein NTV00_04010 [Methylococcales bacterium]|nr:hypothetical protein [Methylococcales bacterium]
MKKNILYRALPVAIALLINTPYVTADINSDTDAILNWAEKTYPTLLPSHETTKTLEPYLYRNYPVTDLYVGINKQNNNVYYISGTALNKGDVPILFDSVANVLKQATPANTSNTECNTATLPTGVTATQSGNVVKIATNGCIPEPTDTNTNFCASTATGNVSIKATITFETIKDNVSRTSKSIVCTAHALGNNGLARVESDLCYTKGTPPVSTRTKGLQIFEQVDDCLKTDAQIVSDLLTNETYINSGSGFIKIPSLPK